MPDWTYHTLLRPAVDRVPRRAFRAWARSRLGRAIVQFLGDHTSDPRIGALADRDTSEFAKLLGVGFTVPNGPGSSTPLDALGELNRTGRVVLDLRRGGPGLAKRVHEATLPDATHAPCWGFLLLGIGMIAAGIVAWFVAATSVVLPYDEAYVHIPEGLFPFLAHDRITLAGTMISIGILYTALAVTAGDAPWNRRAMLISGTLGFGNFFLFLAFGYFDPLHATISVALFPFFVWGLSSSGRGSPRVGVPDLVNDAAWRRAQWGTLGFVALGLGLLVGGIVIAIVGSTTVLVPSDTRFLGSAPEGTRLLSVIAHDRAGFGGALASNGALIACAAMWGIRRGATSLWWALAAAGAVGFGSALGVHVAIGYVDPMHLAPVVIAFGIFVASLAALWSYMQGGRRLAQ